MPRNGSGTYSLPAGNPVTTGTVIDSSVHNTTLSDIASALTASIAKDGQTTPTANLPMGTYRHTNVGAAVARTDYVRYDQAHDNAIQYVGTVGGTATAITLTPNVAYTALAVGMKLSFIAAADATGNTTINVSSIGATSLRIGPKNNTLRAGVFYAGDLLTIQYDGTYWKLLSPLRPFLKGANIASDSAMDFTASAVNGDYMLMTGTTAISSITMNDGDRKTVRLNAAVTLKNSASFVLPGGADISAQSGDIIVLRQDTGVTYVESYTPISGKQVASYTVEKTTAGMYGPNVGMLNGQFTVSAGAPAANQLRISLKTQADADPTAADPIVFFYRGGAAVDGSYSKATLESAKSLTITNGSTLGGHAANEPFRLWVVYFPASQELGVINARDAVSNSIYRFTQSMRASSTAEGGAGAADLAQTIYTASAVTNRGIVVLGYATWNNGLAVPGAWASAPTVTTQHAPGLPLPGDVVQRQMDRTTSIVTCSTVVPIDNTAPTSTEGAEVIDVIITPESGANVIRVSGAAEGTTATGNALIVGFVQKGTTTEYVTAVPAGNTTPRARVVVDYQRLASEMSALTFNFRVGPETGALVFYVNGAAGGSALFASNAVAWIAAEEIMG